MGRRPSRDPNLEVSHVAETSARDFRASGQMFPMSGEKLPRSTRLMFWQTFAAALCRRPRRQFRTAHLPLLAAERKARRRHPRVPPARRTRMPRSARLGAEERAALLTDPTSPRAQLLRAHGAAGSAAVVARCNYLKRQCHATTRTRAVNLLACSLSAQRTQGKL